MKIRFWCESGANADSCREEIVDVRSTGLSPEEWAALTDAEKQEEAWVWAGDKLEIGFEELE